MGTGWRIPTIAQQLREKNTPKHLHLINVKVKVDEAREILNLLAGNLLRSLELEGVKLEEDRASLVINLISDVLFGRIFKRYPPFLTKYSVLAKIPSLRRLCIGSIDVPNEFFDAMTSSQILSNPEPNLEEIDFSFGIENLTVILLFRSQQQDTLRVRHLPRNSLLAANKDHWRSRRLRTPATPKPSGAPTKKRRQHQRFCRPHPQPLPATNNDDCQNFPSFRWTIGVDELEPCGGEAGSVLVPQLLRPLPAAAITADRWCVVVQEEEEGAHDDADDDVFAGIEEPQRSGDDAKHLTETTRDDDEPATSNICPSKEVEREGDSKVLASMNYEIRSPAVHQRSSMDDHPAISPIFVSGQPKESNPTRPDPNGALGEELLGGALTKDKNVKLRKKTKEAATSAANLGEDKPVEVDALIGLMIQSDMSNHSNLARSKEAKKDTKKRNENTSRQEDRVGTIVVTAESDEL